MDKVTSEDVMEHIGIAEAVIASCRFPGNLSKDEKMAAAMVAIAQALATHDPEKSQLSTWVRTCVRFAVLKDAGELISHEGTKDTKVFLMGDLAERVESLVLKVESGDDSTLHYQLSTLIESFPEKWKRIVRLRSQGMTQKEIAKEVGVSQSAVCRILLKAYECVKFRVES